MNRANDEERLIKLKNWGQCDSCDGLSPNDQHDNKLLKVKCDDVPMNGIHKIPQL